MRKLLLIINLLLPICIYASFFDNFSDSSLSEEWGGDRLTYKIEENKLKLDASKESSGSAALSCLSGVSENATWIVKGKMNFKPSSSNFCQICLMADAPEISRISNGLFLQIGGSNKNISLYRAVDGKNRLLKSSVENRVALDTVSFEVKISLTSENQFEVFSKINSEVDFTKDFSIEKDFSSDSQFFILNCVYTKTRAKSFSFDYVEIKGEDSKLPILKLVRTDRSESSVDLFFNRSIEPSSVKISADDNSKIDYSVNRNVLSIFSDFIEENASGTISFSACDFTGNCISGEKAFENFPTPQKGEIQINEIMYDPQTGGAEFIELRNNTDKCFLLKDLLFAKPSALVSSKYAFYKCAENDEKLSPNGYALLSKDVEAVCQSDECGEGEKVSLQKFPALSNEGGNIFLFNRDTFLVDSVCYDKSMHTVLSSKTKGVSLERSCESNQFFSSVSATPCRENSICRIVNMDDADEYVRMNNSVITFGSENIEIEYSLPFENVYLLAVVYDRDGREIRKLSSEEKIGSIGEITWDGTDNEGKYLPASPYILYLHFYTAERKGGIKKRFLCTIGER